MATSTFSAKIVNLVGAFSDEDALDDWMAEGAKEIISVLPDKLKVKCSTITLLNNSATTMDLDGVGDVLYVTRENADSGYQVPCREIPAIYGGLATDSDSLDYYGTVTDPVYWMQSGTDTIGTEDAGTLFVKPDPTANQVGYVHHISYPSVDASGVNTIANFPDEAEHLVVLYAAIKATEHMMLSEEDQEVYAPQLGTLKQDYAQGLVALKGGQ